LFEAVPELQEREKASYLEIKAFRCTDILTTVDVLTPVYHHKTFFLDLSEGLDSLWPRFHRTGVKQKIRRAEKSGIQVRAATCEEDVRVFHTLLVDSRKRLGLPPQRVSYFLNVWRHLVPRGMAGFLIAERTGRPVGGLCLFKFKDTMFLAYIGTAEELQPEGVGQGLWWRALQMAEEEGFTTVDLGKTSPHAKGLITYKERWGGQEMETPVFYFPRFKGLARLDNEERVTHRLMRSAWRVMPSPLCRSAAQIAYRHMG
jgi:lipid II:glycine glycyltransferase (peptidoglycan interpeptide bridge formation enzyme)